MVITSPVRPARNISSPTLVKYWQNRGRQDCKEMPRGDRKILAASLTIPNRCMWRGHLGAMGRILDTKGSLSCELLIFSSRSMSRSPEWQPTVTGVRRKAPQYKWFVLDLSNVQNLFVQCYKWTNCLCYVYLDRPDVQRYNGETIWG